MLLTWVRILVVLRGVAKVKPGPAVVEKYRMLSVLTSNTYASRTLSTVVIVQVSLSRGSINVIITVHKSAFFSLKPK